MPVPGMKLAQALDEPGVVRLKCDAGHTWMGAYVVVTAARFVAVTGADGRFRIEGVPPGRHALSLWHEKLESIDLLVGAITVDDPAFLLSKTALTVTPGEAGWFEFVFDPPADGGAVLRIESNDVDRCRVELPITLGRDGRLGVGDTLDDEFGFLDPSGAGQLEGLDGHVVVLAYFALF